MKKGKVEIVVIIAVMVAVIGAFVLCCLIAGGELKKDETTTQEVKGAAVLLIGEIDAESAEIQMVFTTAIKGSTDALKVYLLTAGDKKFIISARVSEMGTIQQLEVSGAYERPNN